MSSTTNSSINRRKLLTTSAKIAISAGFVTGTGLNPVSAMTNMLSSENSSNYWTKARVDRYLCSEIHFAKSQALSKVLASSKLDEAEKNLALRTTHCPSCGIHIQPGGHNAGYRIGV